MKRILVGLGFGLALSVAPLTTWVLADNAPPAWAYPVNPPDFKPAPDDGTPRHVPDSTAAYTVTQARDLFEALDWHPRDHPPMPDPVAHGRRPDVMACGVCHRADGPGGPENAHPSWAASAIHHPADGRLQKWCAHDIGAAAKSTTGYYQDGKSRLRCRSREGRRLFRQSDTAGED